MLGPNAINYQHLLYFWAVAKEGSVTAATRVLNLAQPTISGQLRVLEESLGEKLFQRQGRRLVLTEMGEVVFRYADEIFTLGSELRQALAGVATPQRQARFSVGISDSLPKLTTYRLLEPALSRPHAFRTLLRIGKAEQLTAQLASHQLDLVLTDAPITPQPNVRVFNHLLGECGVTVFATASLAQRHKKHFPSSLHGAPFLLPTANTALRRSLDEWMQAHAIQPHVVAEVEDVALLQVLGSHGHGLFAAPSVVEAEVRESYGVKVVGRIRDVRERFYAISVERRLSHPGVLAISRAARHSLFGTAGA